MDRSVGRLRGHTGSPEILVVSETTSVGKGLMPSLSNAERAPRNGLRNANAFPQPHSDRGQVGETRQDETPATFIILSLSLSFSAHAMY